MKKITAMLSLLICALILCGCSEKVEFAGGTLDAESSEITIALKPGETALLDRFPALTSADLRGSEDFLEVQAWAEAHPQVEVLWSVPMPDGSKVDSSTESLDLSQVPMAIYIDYADRLQYLPNLREISFGKTLSAANLGIFVSRYPGLQYDCEIKLGDKVFSSHAQNLDFTGTDDSTVAELCRVLPAMDKLSRVELGSEESSPALSWESIAMMQAAAPDTDFAYSFTLYDKPFTTLDTEMDINHIRIYDEGELVRKAISMMPALKVLDMDSCGVSNESMAAIRDDFPNVKVIWRIWFGDNYTARTDIEKILASRPSLGGNLVVGNVENLKYCTDLKYLDIGHNNYLETIDFVSYMPKLEVFIVALAAIEDISPLANCPELEFLEIQTTQVKDISALSGLTKLRHLNICRLHELTDISPIMDLELDRLWIGCHSPVPEEQVEEYRRRHPDCSVNDTTVDPHDEGWRYAYDGEKYTGGFSERYAILVQQFGYDRLDYAFPWKDPKY